MGVKTWYSVSGWVDWKDRPTMYRQKVCTKESVTCACFVSALDSHIYVTVRHSECLKMLHCLRIACCKMMG